MARLLTAQRAAVFRHVLVHILVAHGGLGVGDALPVEGAVQPEVGHDGGHHRIAGQLTLLLQVLPADVEDVVAGDDGALLIHREAPVGVAVVGEADVQPVGHHEPPQGVDMGGAHAVVDVEAVRLVAHHIGLGPQRVEHALGDGPCAAVGAVQAHLHALEGEHPQRDEVAHIPVAPGGIVHRAADALPLGQRNLLPHLAEHLQPAVQIVLDQGDGVLVHLLAGAVDELDAVVVVGVVAGGDHNAAVECLRPRHIGHGGRGGHMQQVGVRTGGHQPGGQRVLKHVAAAPRVLADDHPHRRLVPGAALQLAVVPAQKAAHLIGVIRRQIHIGLPTEAVRPEIASHCVSPPLYSPRWAVMSPPRL